MTEQEAAETYQSVASMLDRAGFRWVLEEVEDALAEGIAVEVIPEVAEHQALISVERIWPSGERSRKAHRARRRTEPRTRFRSPTALERLASLREAIRAVFLDTDRMGGVVSKELGVAASAVSFVPDGTNADTEFARPAASQHDVGAMLLTQTQRERITALLVAMGGAKTDDHS